MFLAVFISLLAHSDLHSDDWPNWLGPSHNGVSKETGWSTQSGETLWEKQLGIGFSAVSVSNSRLYTLGHDGRRQGGNETFFCLEAATGKEIWKHTYPAQLVNNLHEGGPAASPTVDGGMVYGLSKDGKLTCYEAATGKQFWNRNLLTDDDMPVPEWGFAGSPLVLGDKLIVEASSTFALNKTSGEILWKSARHKPAYGSPAAFEQDGRPFVATLKTDGLVVLNAETGKTLAFTPWLTRFRTSSTTPLIVNGRIFISTGYNRGCALFELGGALLKQIYTNQNFCNHMNNSVHHDGYLYGFDGNTHMAGPKDLVCLNFATGKEIWRHEQSLKVGSLMSADGKLIILSETGELVIATASHEGFSPLSRKEVLDGRCWTMPVLANGRIYCRNAAGRLVCIDME
ncbi:MAG: PQQ-binding-like beta-propeller repeat protein [Planctomycetota bacterium]|nr:PQQ-binding-like beta-propeller repeat protein [Planctomycetota bacterium]